MSDTGQTGGNDWKKRNTQGSDEAVDRRAMRTRAALHTALIRLILTKDYDEISVSDIVDEADVGRSTFYVHFTGKDDLLRNGAGKLREMLLRHRAPAEDGRLFAFGSFLFAHTKEELRLYRAVVRGRAGAIIFDKFRQLLAELMKEELETIAPARPQDVVPRDIAVQFLVGAFMTVLTAWLDRGAKEPAEEMDAAFRRLALHGLQGSGLIGGAGVAETGETLAGALSAR